MPEAPAPTSGNPVNGLTSVGAPGGTCPSPDRRGSPQYKTGDRRNFNLQGASIQTAFQRLNLQRYPIVVDTIATVNARLSIFHRVIEAKTRAEVVGVSSSLPTEERQDDRVELTCAADVFDIGIQFVT